MNSVRISSNTNKLLIVNLVNLNFNLPFNIIILVNK